MEVKKVAFIGLRHGHITSLYQRIKKDPRFEIVAICEEDAKAAADAAAACDMVATHNDFNAMLNEVDFDILADYLVRHPEHIEDYVDEVEIVLAFSCYAETLTDEEINNVDAETLINEEWDDVIEEIIDNREEE